MSTVCQILLNMDSFLDLLRGQGAAQDIPQPEKLREAFSHQRELYENSLISSLTKAM